MASLHIQDWRSAPLQWSQRLAVSKEAVDLYLASDVIDLHIDSFIWPRVFGYDLEQHHGLGRWKGHYFSQLDLPRAWEAQLSGVWSITTNPLGPLWWRRRTFFRNLRALKTMFARHSAQFACVADVSSYQAARKQGKLGVFVGIQGGQVLAPEDIVCIKHDIVRVTLMGFTHSALGVSSQTVPAWLPKPRHTGLTSMGRRFVEALDDARIFVDLAHCDPVTFADAVDAHDASIPLLISHTGARSVYDTPRNFTDAQLRKVADTGGVIGVIFKAGVIGPKPVTADAVVDHMEHIVGVVGEDHVALGADWDGVMVPPVDVPSPIMLPRLVQRMLDRGWRAERIVKVLGGNVLRALELLRPKKQ